VCWHTQGEKFTTAGARFLRGFIWTAARSFHRRAPRQSGAAIDVAVITGGASGVEMKHCWLQTGFLWMSMVFSIGEARPAEESALECEPKSY
jgi:hypothetical protein